jgi:cobalamin biosynthesis Mg chelatase CobN
MHCGAGPYAAYYDGGNITLSEEIKARTNAVCTEMGIKPYRSVSFGSMGYSIGDAVALGVQSAWIIETVGQDTAWRHLQENYDELVNVYLDKCLAVFVAACELSGEPQTAIPTSTPTPAPTIAALTSTPTPSTPNPTPTPPLTPTSTPQTTAQTTQTPTLQPTSSTTPKTTLNPTVNPPQSTLPTPPPTATVTTQAPQASHIQEPSLTPTTSPSVKPEESFSSQPTQQQTIEKQEETTFNLFSAEVATVVLAGVGFLVVVFVVSARWKGVQKQAKQVNSKTD